MDFNQLGYGSTSDSTEYWSTHRSKVSDLYKSESYFFKKIVPEVRSVLDLGCAAGGSFCFSRELNPNIAYNGIDISPELIEAAQRRFQSEKNATFKHFDGKIVPLAHGSVEFAFSFGVFHHISDWKAMANELLRTSSRYVLFDLRVWENDTLANSPTSYQKIALGGEWDGKTIIQYNIQSFNEVMSFCSQLKEQNISTKLYGYYAKPTSLAVTPAQKVLMLAVLMEKKTSSPELSLLIE